MALYDNLGRYGSTAARPFGLNLPGLGAIPILIGVCTALCDLGTTVALSVTSSAVYTAVTGVEVSYGRSVEWALVLAAIFVTLGFRDGSYDPRTLAAWRPARMATKWFLAVGLLLAIAFLSKLGAYYSRGVTLVLTPLGFIGLGSTRYVISCIVQQAIDRNYMRPPRIAVIGEGEACENSLRERIKADNAVQIAEYVALSKGDEAVKHVVALSQAGLIDEIVIALPWTRMDDVESIVSTLRRQALPVHLLPDLQALDYMSRPSQLGSLPVFELKRAALNPRDLLLKRTFDIVIASVALIILSPLLFVTALIVKAESPGPVFFRQRRHGFNNREFRIFKFRSMKVTEDGPTISQAVRNDPRITRFGRFIRKTSIDELPQLINVLRGEMSIVGPRPHAVAHNDEWVTVVENYAQRHNILPGITGLAQVKGLRGEADTPEKLKERVRLDLAYIEQWSLALDIRIVAMTAAVLFFQKTAY
jgi:Undecaprenyl-phosphate glucose phosphotransferase